MTPETRPQRRHDAKPSSTWPGLDLPDFLPTRRVASAPSPTLVQPTKRGRGLPDLVDPSVAATIEQLEAIGRELARRSPLELLHHLHARTTARVALLRTDEP